MEVLQTHLYWKLGNKSTIYLMNSNAQYTEFAAINSLNKKQQLWDKTLKNWGGIPNIWFFSRKGRKEPLLAYGKNCWSI